MLYDRTSSQEFVNGARKQLFTQKGRAIGGLPPTQAALLQHTKRAAYQTGHCWAQAMIATPELPSPFGKYAGQLFLKLHKLVENYCAVVARRDALDYLSVSKAGLQCTALCFCGGLCARS